MQTKVELEEFYKTPDPWGYTDNEDDFVRQMLIVEIARIINYPSYQKALDIGCGEGVITKELSAIELYGIEISDTAAKRFPDNVKRVKKPTGKYDLITACGVLYEQYDYEQMREWIEKHASNKVITCHYDKAGVAHDQFNKPQIFYAEFPYREGKQIMRVYQW